MARKLRDVTNVCAEALRRPVSLMPFHSTHERAHFDPASCKVICVASGKGGTGKTIVSTNLALALTRCGFRVILLDADLGLANAHLLLGVEPSHDISSVISGTKSIDEISIDCSEGLRLIAGGSGLSELTELKEWQFKNLASQLRASEKDADIMIIDLAAGISPQVMRFLINAHDVIIVTTPDVTAQIDAYATIKTMAKAREGLSVKVVMNRARGEDEAVAAYKKLADVVRNRLKGVKTSLLEWIPQNWYVQNSVHMRRPVVDLHPKSFVTRKFLSMAEDLKAEHGKWLRKVKSSGTNAPASFSQMLERINFR